MAAHRRKDRESKAGGRRTPTKRSRILAIDIGGTNVKMLATGENDPLKIPSGKTLTPGRLVEEVLQATREWKFEAVSIGYPGLVGVDGPHSEPGNLAPGWVGFDFAAAFGRPVKIINDAAMQALGSYAGGRMLFLGLGTGLGSTLITENVIVPLELGELPYEGNERLGMVLGRRGLERVGKRVWRKVVIDVVDAFTRSFLVDYVVLGGGNAKLLKEPPSGARLGHNLTAFRGGFRLWHLADVPTLAPEGEVPAEELQPTSWRVV